MKKLFVALITVMFTAGLSACNTVKGFGKDVERGGEGIQKSSDNVRSGGSSSGSTSNSGSR